MFSFRRNICEVRYLSLLYKSIPAYRNGPWKLDEGVIASPTTTPPPLTTKTAGNFTAPTQPAVNVTQPPITTPRVKPRIKEILILNSCNTTYLPMGMGLVFPHLKILIVWFSGLRELNHEYFKDMPKLRELNLRDNEIAFLVEPLLAFVGNITSLDIGFNFIVEFPEKFLYYTPKLQTFIANHNLIEVLQPTLFAGSPVLSFVNLNNNKIKAIGVDFVAMRSLKKLLGLGNVCADFFLTKNFTAAQLNDLVRKNCSIPQQPQPGQPG